MLKSLHVVQAALVLIVTGAFYVWQGETAAKAAMYGGAIVLLNGYILTARMRKASEIAKTSPEASVKVLYIGALQRFVLTLVALGLGFKYLGQAAAVPLLAGFALPQMGFLLTEKKPIDGLASSDASEKQNSN